MNDSYQLSVTLCTVMFLYLNRNQIFNPRNRFYFVLFTSLSSYYLLHTEKKQSSTEH